MPSRPLALAGRPGLIAAPTAPPTEAGAWCGIVPDGDIRGVEPKVVGPLTTGLPVTAWVIRDGACVIIDWGTRGLAGAPEAGTLGAGGAA